MREIRYVDAIREALLEEVRRDESVCILGEGVGFRGGAFTETKGIWDEFGDRRVVDTPISELGFVGLAVGAAMTGLRPIVDLTFWDFAFETSGQIIMQAARAHYVSNGQIKVPLVIIAVIGMDQSGGAHHSGAPYPLYAHMPGLKVLVPSTPYDAKGLLKSAIRDNDPVLFFYHRGLNNSTGTVPEDEYVVPLGQAIVRREGTDVTLVATSKMVFTALEAADKLASEGISVELIDPRTLVPLDKATVLASIRKTNRVVVVDEAYSPFGVGGEIAALAADETFYHLDAPIKRVHSPSVPAPLAPPLEQAVIPSVERVIAVVREAMSQ